MGHAISSKYDGSQVESDWSRILEHVGSERLHEVIQGISKRSKYMILTELKSQAIALHLENNPLENSVQFYSAIRDEILPRNKRLALDKLEKDNEKGPLRGYDFYHRKYFHSVEKLRLFVARSPRKQQILDQYEKAEDALEISFLAARLRLLALRLNASQIFRNEDQETGDSFLKEADGIIQRNLHIPIVKLLCNWVLVLIQPGEHRLVTLSTSFWNQFDQLEADLQGDIFANLLNRLLIINNREGGNLLACLYMFYRTAELSGLLPPEKSYPGLVKNYVTICLRLGLRAEGERLLGKYQSRLPGHYLQFAKAELAFARGDWKSVLRNLTILQTGYRESMKDAFFAQGVRILEIKAGYEQMMESKTVRDTTFVATRTQAYITYLKKQKILKPEIVEGSLGFANGLLRLIKSSKKATIQKLWKDLLRGEVRMDQRKWLFQKVEVRLEEDFRYR